MIDPDCPECNKLTGGCSQHAMLTIYPIRVPQASPQYGWVCPKCGSVYAPFMPQCSKCSKERDEILNAFNPWRDDVGVSGKHEGGEDSKSGADHEASQS